MAPPPPVHGNFRHYYGMRSARAARAGGDADVGVSRVDVRIAALLAWYAHTPRRTPRRVLDVGCNAAKPLIELAQLADPPLDMAVGVDIDAQLIHDAHAAVRAAWSRTQPDAHGRVEAAAYFPACFAAQYGPLPLPPRGAAGFPGCIALHAGDWVEGVAALAAEDARGYDLILWYAARRTHTSFALTKWVHLNAGDAGLVRLCARLAACVVPGGIVALEVQPWASYDQARSVSRTLRAAYAQLQLRPDDVAFVMETVGLVPLGTVATGTGYGTLCTCVLTVRRLPAPDRAVCTPGFTCAHRGGGVAVALGGPPPHARVSGWHVTTAAPAAQSVGCRRGDKRAEPGERRGRFGRTAMGETDLSVDIHRDYASAIWSDAQKRAVNAMGDAVIASLTPEEHAKFMASLPPTIDAAQRERAERYASLKFSDDPEMANWLAMMVTIAVPTGVQRRLNLLLYLMTTRLGCVPLFGRVGPVWDIPRKEREAALVGWQASRLKLLRQGGSGLKGLIIVTFYRGSDAALEAIGYPTGAEDWMNPPDGKQEPADEPYPYTFLNRTLQPGPDGSVLEHETDVLIVGSGSGGGVAASYLAQRGLRVTVIDKGIYVPTTEMHGIERFGMEQMHERLGLVPSTDGSIFVLAGAGFGGGTTINWSATLKPRHFVRRAWATQYGVPYFATNLFTNDLDACIERMGASAEHIQHNRANSLLVIGGLRGGQPVNAVPQNTGGHTHYCGKCAVGCPSGHKQGSVQTWLRDAAEHGAQFATHCDVERVVIDRGRATGVVARIDGRPVRFHAKKAVVMSAGSLNTPAVLLRTPELKVNRQIGRNLFLHPVAFVHGYYDFPVNPWEGSALTTVSNAAELVDTQGWGAKVEVIASLPGLYNAVTPFESGLAHKERAMRYRHSFTMIIIVRDRYGGRITLNAHGEPEIEYQLSKYDERSMIAGVLRATEIHMNAGAVEIATSQPKVRSFVTPTPAPAPEKTSNVIAGCYPFETMPPQGDIMHPGFRQWQDEVAKEGFASIHALLGSAHQMGSCRMGGDAKHSAADPLGHVRGTRNLWVADGSALPEAPGVNPMLTIMGTARGVARNIAQELGVEQSAPAPGVALPAHL